MCGSIQIHKLYFDKLLALALVTNYIIVSTATTLTLTIIIIIIIIIMF